ncbi:MAG: hypothetical protein IH626_08475 [Rhodospirillales bacterium]|nr:hypothetical protein [Rhodospirillales bacterium]
MRLIAVLTLSLLVGACSTARDTLPARAATEQLLLSAAVDRAARQITLNIPRDKKVYVDSLYVEGYDSKYAAGAIRDSLLKQGIRLANTRADADAIVEARIGALSIDERQRLVGIPSTPLPIPLAGELTTPEIAFFKKHQWKGIAKLAVTAYDAKSGILIDSSGPQFGASDKTDWVFLLFISATTDSLRPEEGDPEPTEEAWWKP